MIFHVFRKIWLRNLRKNLCHQYQLWTNHNYSVNVAIDTYITGLYIMDKLRGKVHVVVCSYCTFWLVDTLISHKGNIISMGRKFCCYYILNHFSTEYRGSRDSDCCCLFRQLDSYDKSSNEIFECSLNITWLFKSQELFAKSLNKFAVYYFGQITVNYNLT